VFLAHFSRLGLEGAEEVGVSDLAYLLLPHGIYFNAQLMGFGPQWLLANVRLLSYHASQNRKS
jgi:hypothetical protein